MTETDFTAQPDTALRPQPGERLAAAREGRGMTVAEIAQQLKLSPWQVEALEAGDYRRLPSSVFVRGFIRNYARLVKLDPAELLDGLEKPAAHAAAPLEPPVAKSAPEVYFPGAQRTNWRPYAIAAAVVVAALGIYEFYPESAPPSEPVVQAPAPATAPGAPIPDEAAQPGAVAGSPAVPAQPAPAAAAPEPVAVSPVAAKTADTVRPDKTPAVIVESRASAGEQVVRMRFARESWVEIRDRNGRKIFSQLNPAGTEQVVSGLPPLSVIVGNANGVQLTHNEQPVDLARYTKIDVARLTLE